MLLLLFLSFLLNILYCLPFLIDRVEIRFTNRPVDHGKFQGSSKSKEKWEKSVKTKDSLARDSFNGPVDKILLGGFFHI